MKTGEELKSCPFCGGKAIVVQYGYTKQSHIVICDDCGCILESNEVEPFWNSSWNKRCGFVEVKLLNKAMWALKTISLGVAGSTIEEIVEYASNKMDIIIDLIEKNK